RSSANEDRYFPYDGTHPLTVTLYTVTWDQPNEAGVTTIVPADAVRLVPESQRGDIHAPAASFTTGIGVARTNLTYFARDETTGPKPINTLLDAQASNPGADGFLPIPWDPTKPSTPKTGNNPDVDDIT